MKLLRDLILIKVEAPKENTESGFYVPSADRDGWKSLPPRGTVIEVGPEATDIKPGQKVVFERYASIMLDHDLDNGLRICRPWQILAVIEDES